MNKRNKEVLVGDITPAALIIGLVLIACADYEPLFTKLGF